MSSASSLSTIAFGTSAVSITLLTTRSLVASICGVTTGEAEATAAIAKVTKFVKRILDLYFVVAHRKSNNERIYIVSALMKSQKHMGNCGVV